MTEIIKEALYKYGGSLLAVCLTFLAPLNDVFLLVGGLVAADYITGLIKAHKSNTFSSAKAIAKFYTSIGYFIGILIARGMELYIGQDIFVKAVVAVIAISEIQSLRENIKEISGVDILKPIANLFKKNV